jgi:hypothetical protein
MDHPTHRSSAAGVGAMGRVEALAHGPFAVGAMVFRDTQGRLIGTIVAKASYALAVGVCPLLDTPMDVQERDGHWDDDPTKSVHVPSDLVPFKRAPEVVVMGSAFAPDGRPVPSVMTRVVVGSVDKTVEAWGPRFFRLDGSLEDPQRQRRFSLRYEHAAGGPDTDNPAGIDVTRADGWGRHRLPELLPPTWTPETPGQHAPTSSFGPIAAHWPARSRDLAEADRAWLEHIVARPLPPGFPSSFFQAAPRDQWLVRPLAPNERLVLENLHASHARLTTSLPGIEPYAAVLGGKGDPIRMLGDLLFVDTDRAICTLTFRAHVPLDEGAGAIRVLVVGVPMGKDAAEAARQAVASAQSAGPPPERRPDDDAEKTHDSLPAGFKLPLPFAGQGAAGSASRASYADGALPFPGGAKPAPPTAQPKKKSTTLVTSGQVSRPSFGDSALPFTSAPPAAAPIAPAPPPLMPPAPPPLVPPAPPPLMPPAPLPLAPAVPAAPAAPVALSAPAAPTPAPAPEAASPSRSSTGKSPFLAALRAKPGSPGTTDAGSAKADTAASGVSVQAASDAAAGQERTREGRALSSPIRPSNQPEPPRRLAVVDLLAFEPRIAPRLRALDKLAGLWSQPQKPRAPLHVDAARAAPPDPDRADILRALSCGRSATAAEIRGVLAASLDDLTDLEPPIVLVAGELVPTLDELETLRASAAVAQSVAGTDKRVLGAIAVAQEALAAPLPPSAETVRSLAKQIEQASASLSLPPRFVASQVERILLEGRKYKRRQLLGATRVRADLVLPGGETFPLYVPDAASASLPLLPSFPVVAVCEVRPREDLAETQAEALLSMALGRVLHSR